VLKIIVTRGSATRRGYTPGTGSARRLVSLWSVEPLPPGFREDITLAVSPIRLAIQPALAGMKHLNRLEQVLASAEAARVPAFDALMLDTSEQVVSGARSNVFVVSAGAVVTPPVNRAGVAGVMRSVVRRECPALGIAFSERPLTLPELLAADEVFITNACIGVVPVSRVGEHHFTMNRVALRLQAHVEALDA
jgi:4-amino-4-deoxychorismate lyase